MGWTRLLERDLEKAMAQFRDVLHQATVEDPGRQRYPMEHEDPKRCREDLWRLAKAGWGLWVQLRTQQEDLWDVFDTVRESTGAHVQIVRLNAGLAFPWSAVYDWELPQQMPAKICLGEAEAGGPCAHHSESASDDALCVLGFWGIRHRLEQLVGKSTPVQQLHAGEVLIAADHTLPGLGGLVAACIPGSASLIPQSVSEVLTSLFEVAAPPAVYVAIGDHITEASANGHPVPHIKIDGTRVIDKDTWEKQSLRKPRWKEKRPLVALMSCNSAVAPTLVVDWVQPLIAKGAAAIVGTEALVFPELAVEATRILLSLLHQRDSRGNARDLSQAMRELNLVLLKRNIPLGFVFTALGDAALRLS